MKYIVLLASTICLLTSCAKQYIPIRYQCLPEPKLEAVIVQDGAIDKVNTPKVISNHVKAWEYIEYLRSKGGCK